MLYTPVRADAAAGDIRKKETECIGNAADREKIGQIEDAAQSAEYVDVLEQEADLTVGHGILRATGLICVSVRDRVTFERAVAAIKQAATQTSREPHGLWVSKPRHSPRRHCPCADRGQVPGAWCSR